MAEQMNGYWTPVNDYGGIIGYTWICVCKRETFLLHEGECPHCDKPLPDIDPNDWYQEEMKKPTKEKAWNQK